MSPNVGVGGWGGLRALNQWVQLCIWSPNKLWRSNSIFNLWLAALYNVNPVQSFENNVQHKVLPYVEYRTVSGVFQNIDPNPLSTQRVYPHPAPKAGWYTHSPELIILVDFKAIYPGVPPGIFASFPGVVHFLSFEEICQYPRVPQGIVANPWGTLGY